MHVYILLNLKYIISIILNKCNNWIIRSRRLCWPVSEDKIKNYIETEKFVDDELDPAINTTLRSAIQKEQAEMDAIDNERSESSNEDEEDDDQLRKYDTPVISLMPEYNVRNNHYLDLGSDFIITETTQITQEEARGRIRREIDREYRTHSSL